MGLLAPVLLELGVFPTIVDSLAVEVMSVEVLLGLGVEKLRDIHQKLSSYPSTGQLHLVINPDRRGLCGFAHVKFNNTRESSMVLHHAVGKSLTIK